MKKVVVPRIERVFGERIRKERTALGLGLNELCRKLKISPTYLSRIERGIESHTPSEEIVVALAVALRLDKDEMLNLAGKIPQDIKAAILADAGMPALIRAVSVRGLRASDVLEGLA